MLMPPPFRAAAFTLIVGIVHAQAPSNPPLKFEEASIHRADPGKKGPPWAVTPAGRLTATTDLRWLLQVAYSVRFDQIVGGPKWMDGEEYTIVAVPPPGSPLATDQRNVNKIIEERLRALLEDRFQLKVHREMREMPVYELTVAKGGSKLKEEPESPEFKLRLPSGRILTSGGGAKIAMLTILLTNQLHRPVVDKTGLMGLYAFDLTYNPDESKPSDRPSLFTALQEQLGLKLDAKKGESEVLVIDRLERPSEN
jgi:uncharacterized protein (TIGR03435 family)